MRSNELTGKKCYDHLGGKLGATIFSFLIKEEWIEPQNGTPTTYVITKKGSENFKELGLSLPTTTE